MVQKRILPVSAVIAAAVIASCNAGVPVLTLGASPTTLEPNGKKARITASATGIDGNIGTGSVRFSVDVGTLTDETVRLDEFGSATTTYTCDRATNPDCTDRATITAKWETNKTTVIETLSIRFMLNTGTGGGAAAGSAGGGAAGGGTVGPEPQVLSFCGDPARPAAATCCRNSMIATSGTAFPCPATRIPPGAEFDVPFASTSSGMMITVRFKWNAPVRPTTLAACQAMPPSVSVVNNPTLDLNDGAVIYNILPTGFWGVPTPDVIPVSLGRPLRELCDIAFAQGNVGVVMVFESRGGTGRLGNFGLQRGTHPPELYNPTNQMSYFFLLEKG